MELLNEYTSNMASQQHTFYPVNLERLTPREKLDIVTTLNSLNDRLGANSEEFFVIGGANLVLRGIRKVTEDIDLLVSDDAFSAMESMNGSRLKLPPKRAISQGATNSSVWINTSWTRAPISAAKEMGDGYFPMSYSRYFEVECDYIEGHACVPLEDVLGSKLAIQRRKDLEDIEAIAKFTGQTIAIPEPKYTGLHLDS
jgi:hypothetical protein